MKKTRMDEMQVETATTDLIQRAKNGDRKAFGDLYDQNFDKIYRHIYYRTLHKETAEDMTGQAFLKALDKLHTFDPEKGHFLPWLYRIAGNLLIDHFRKTSKVEEVSALWDLEDQGDFTIDLHNKMAWEAVKPALDALDKEKRELIILRIWDDLTFKEIAEITGKSEGACKMSFARTLQYLKDTVSLSLIFFIMTFPKWIGG